MNELTSFISIKVFLSTMQLRLEEERCKESEARVRELEKQVLALFIFWYTVLLFPPIDHGLLNYCLLVLG